MASDLMKAMFGEAGLESPTQAAIPVTGEVTGEVAGEVTGEVLRMLRLLTKPMGRSESLAEF